MFIHQNNHTWSFSNFERTLWRKQRSLTQLSSLSTKPVFVPSVGEIHVCMCVRLQSYIHTYITYSIPGKLYGQSVYTRFELVPQIELQSNSRYSTCTSSLWTKPENSGVDAMFCTFRKRSTSMYVCTCTVSHGHSCTVRVRVQNHSCREERTFGWVAINLTNTRPT